MSTDSPPGSSRPRASGEFTWPPTSEELDAIEVILLDGSPAATVTPATPPSASAAAATSTAAPRPNTLDAPTTLVVPTAAVVAKKPKTIDTPVIGRRHRPRPARLPLRRREDLAYIGVTIASTLAIAVAAMLQLSDSRSTPPAALPVTAPAAAASATGLSNTDSPTASALSIPSTPPAPSVSSVTPPARTADALASRESRATARTPPTPMPTRRATHARRSAQNVALRERRNRGDERARARAHTRERDRASLAADYAVVDQRSSTLGARRARSTPVASPPLRLPESYVQPRVVSQRPGRHRGQVVLAVQVRANGRVGDIEVLSKDDDRVYDDLERAAVSAVKRWRYRPALRDGVPTPARVKVVVNFS